MDMRDMLGDQGDDQKNEQKLEKVMTMVHQIMDVVMRNGDPDMTMRASIFACTIAHASLYKHMMHQLRQQGTPEEDIQEISEWFLENLLNKENYTSDRLFTLKILDAEDVVKNFGIPPMFKNDDKKPN